MCLPMGFEELTTPASRLLRFGLNSTSEPISEEKQELSGNGWGAGDVLVFVVS